MLPYVDGQAMVGTISPLPAELHRQLKNPAVKIFSMTSLVTFEGFINSSIRVFFSQLDKLYTHGESCDIGAWIELFVYDVLGELTFSKRYGLLEMGRDVDNIISDVDSHFNKVSLVRFQHCLLDYILAKVVIGGTNAVDRHTSETFPYSFMDVQAAKFTANRISNEAHGRKTSFGGKGSRRPRCQ